MAGGIDAFIAKWQGASGGERSQSQSFLKDFCQAPGLEDWNSPGRRDVIYCNPVADHYVPLKEFGP
ncbi:MAG: hypothetical protein JNM20_09660 [Rhizobiales bacterium]|nr:hypothetical protein [Hyphomicrobiales bacterium]